MALGRRRRGISVQGIQRRVPAERRTFNPRGKRMHSGKRGEIDIDDAKDHLFAIGMVRSLAWVPFAIRGVVGGSDHGGETVLVDRRGTAMGGRRGGG